MTAKEYLRSIHELDRSIQDKQRKLDWLERNCDKIRSSYYGGVRLQVNSWHPIDDIIVKLGCEIKADTDRLIGLEAEARIRISKVYHQCFIDLLTDVYIHGLTLERVAEKYDKSYATICRWHGQALRIFRYENGMS